ncbi:MAG: pyrophosphokinae [Pyrinomonadaceae bacterium]|nr:pyrophosphokinae [Pyrinomonadaceae bacterium]
MDSQSADSDELARTWDERPEIIRAFIEIRPQYEHLCSEIDYILRKRMNDHNIEFSTITSRAKTLKSFTEKLSRKQYDEPLKNVTDLAGVRLVYLYKSDRPDIEKIIEAEFEVIEMVDKVEEQEVDKFGYGALHYLVNLGRKSSGARYDDLKGLICEIQVRTVLQDAWAIIDHHLSYKHESDVPKVLKRKLNSLSGLFETADDQFDRVRKEQEEYRQTIKSTLNSRSKFLEQETNLDTFTEFLKWKFPKKKSARDNRHLSRILSLALSFDYDKLSELNKLLKRTQKARAAMRAERSVLFAASEVARAMALEHKSYRESETWVEPTRKLFAKYDHLLSE